VCTSVGYCRLSVEKTTNLSAIAAVLEKSSKHCPWMAQKKDFIMYFRYFSASKIAKALKIS
jgi:hypothetical protein